MEKNVEYILSLSKGLGKLFESEFHGFFIGKAKVEFLGIPKSRKITSKVEITKDLRKYKKCLSYILEEEKVLCKIELTLIRKSNKEVTIIERENKIKGNPFCTISIGEIHKFAKDTGDLNEIHFGEKPVVQGMLIIKYLDEYFRLLQYEYTIINIRFIEPLYANESTSIILESKEFNVYKNNKSILKGSVE